MSRTGNGSQPLTCVCQATKWVATVAVHATNQLAALCCTTHLRAPTNAHSTPTYWATTAFLFLAKLLVLAGVTLNKMCPDWFVSFLLIITYTLSTLQQTRNMIKLRAQEARLARTIKQYVYRTSAVASTGPCIRSMWICLDRGALKHEIA